MLFTDGDYICAADLTSLDAQIVSIAKAEQIQIDCKITTTACQEMGNRILAKVVSFAGMLPPFVSPWSQSAAALNLVGSLWHNAHASYFHNW